MSKNKVVFDVHVPRAFPKCSTCMVFHDFLKKPLNPKNVVVVVVGFLVR